MTGTRTGKLGVTRRDGRPPVTPIWFVLDGDDIVLTTGASSVKGRALQADPRAVLCADDQTPPYSFVIIEGRAQLSDDLEAVRRWATMLGSRYMGAERAAAFGERNAVPGELLVRLPAQKVIAERDIADQPGPDLLGRRMDGEAHGRGRIGQALVISDERSQLPAEAQGRRQVDGVQAPHGRRGDGLCDDPDSGIQVDELDQIQHRMQSGDGVRAMPGQRAEGLDLDQD